MYRLNETREDGMKLIPFCSERFNPIDIPEDWIKIPFSVPIDTAVRKGEYTLDDYIKHLDRDVLIELYNTGQLCTSLQSITNITSDEYDYIDFLMVYDPKTIIGKIEAIDNDYLYITKLPNYDIIIPEEIRDQLQAVMRCYKYSKEENINDGIYLICGWDVYNFNDISSNTIKTILNEGGF